MGRNVTHGPSKPTSKFSVHLDAVRISGSTRRLTAVTCLSGVRDITYEGDQASSFHDSSACKDSNDPSQASLNRNVFGSANKN
ncbi:hypothetical protein RvY_00814 [Ramazzottius varieornatus]|uniref:Uncharacterized protein n=1 Tax=Ramazzottius varieornatus TaxID=947166 RepID=A0A1D1UE27_RAMVA|nr:hypothetical protein RvY_00814 [Ramazzottius varieornatus]